jgi:hypothetical protein
LFGGHADFGVRMDIDASTQPHVIGDAWLPPFGRDAFDVVVMDPPYVGEFQTLNTGKKNALFRAAAWIARHHVYWFSTQWLYLDSRIRLEHTWAVICGRSTQMRCLQKFAIGADKRPPVAQFERGSALKYNRWLAQPQGLPFGAIVGGNQC